MMRRIYGISNKPLLHPELPQNGQLITMTDGGTHDVDNNNNNDEEEEEEDDDDEDQGMYRYQRGNKNTTKHFQD